MQKLPIVDSCKTWKVSLGLCSAICISISNPASAGQAVTLAWDPTPGATGYVCQYGTNTDSLSFQMDAGPNTSVTLSGLAEGQAYHFGVAAYNADGVQSPISEKVTFLVPGVLKMRAGGAKGQPATLSFPVIPNHDYEIQITTNFIDWQTIARTNSISNCWAQLPVSMTNSTHGFFYRLVQH